MRSGAAERYSSCPPEHFSTWRACCNLIVLRFICRPILMLTYRPKVFGRQHVPKSGPFIIASNHIDMFDPIIVAHAVDHPVAFFAKKELFRIPLLRSLLRFLGSFALDRDRPGAGTLKTALNVLRSGGKWALCMFPEGTRSRTGKLLPLRRGVGAIAVRTGLPVVPIAIRRTSSGRFIVTIGETISAIADPDLVQARMEEWLTSLAI
jgi:1-acyl-sn-glycerol-3-phosphate acyltransferase